MLQQTHSQNSEPNECRATILDLDSKMAWFGTGKEHRYTPTSLGFVRPFIDIWRIP